MIVGEIHSRPSYQLLEDKMRFTLWRQLKLTLYRRRCHFYDELKYVSAILRRARTFRWYLSRISDFAARI